MSYKAKIFIILFIAASTWFYFTPHLTVSNIKSAIKEKDDTKLANYVDFPALKESLKANFKAKLTLEIAKKNEWNPLINVLGATLAGTFINPVIDNLVTPESLALMMKGNKPQLNKTAPTEETQSSEEKIEMAMSYEDFDHFIVTVKKSESENGVGFVLNREGLFSWKLSALRL